MDKVRELALKTIYKVDKEKGYSNIVLNDNIRQNKQRLGLTNIDIGFISELVYGTVSNKITLDAIIEMHSKIKLKKISDWILNILRMGIYQIIFLDKVPKSAAVNESVALAKKYGHARSSGFVNAILRKVDVKDLEDLKKINDDLERLSKVYSMPNWIIEELLNEQSLEEVEGILIASSIKPEIAIRVNLLKTNKEELKKLLEKRGIEVKDGLISEFLIVNKMKNIEELEEFKKGYFTIQDEAAGLIAKILNPNTSDFVLDACSAPGGKTTFLAEIMGDKGKIIATDLHEHRVNLVSNTCVRLGINNIKTDVMDCSIFNPNYSGKFDKILLDVPCLGLGVLKRKPDIKWQKSKEDILKISKLQLEILNNVSKYLKIGGTLVYSTCSILKSENDCIIESFLQNNQNFVEEKIEIKEDEYFRKYCEKGRLSVKQNEFSDGFFAVKLKRK